MPLGVVGVPPRLRRWKVGIGSLSGSGGRYIHDGEKTLVDPDRKSRHQPACSPFKYITVIRTSLGLNVQLLVYDVAAAIDHYDRSKVLLTRVLPD